MGTHSALGGPPSDLWRAPTLCVSSSGVRVGALELEPGCAVLPLACSPHQSLHSPISSTDRPVPRVTRSPPKLLAGLEG